MGSKFTHIVGYGSTADEAFNSLRSSFIFYYGGNNYQLTKRVHGTVTMKAKDTKQNTKERKVNLQEKNTKYTGYMIDTGINVELLLLNTTIKLNAILKSNIDYLRLNSFNSIETDYYRNIVFAGHFSGIIAAGGAAFCFSLKKNLFI